MKGWMDGELMGSQRSEGRTRRVVLRKSLESFKKNKVVSRVKTAKKSSKIEI